MVVSAIAWMVIAVPVLWFAGDSFDVLALRPCHAAGAGRWRKRGNSRWNTSAPVSTPFKRCVGMDRHEHGRMGDALYASRAGV